MTIEAGQVLTYHKAITVGRRALVHAQFGHGSTEVHQPASTASRIDDFTAELRTARSRLRDFDAGGNDGLSALARRRCISRRMRQYIGRA
ncbi:MULTISPECIES: hypothetical protein [unclassified Novosphingobium]|uniref:hypothetical protein n=1 Tax=unclassified Novosphingobium TaxID=2644732 RepID=UPI00187E793D|nr:MULTISPECIES: hypothetical protein [unclassified Novosphingobium]MCW1384558.1 hypothetical protein [Novosphingobium sp. KCTC 2891]QOV96597.1 hypothetical protein IM701_21370 [Novosphingobium sp. ES2-1]